MIGKKWILPDGKVVDNINDHDEEAMRFIECRSDLLEMFHLHMLKNSIVIKTSSDFVTIALGWIKIHDHYMTYVDYDFIRNLTLALTCRGYIPDIIDADESFLERHNYPIID